MLPVLSRGLNDKAEEVVRTCCLIFDNMCKVMKENYDLEGDLYPHGSRELVDTDYVCKADYVTQYA